MFDRRFPEHWTTNRKLIWLIGAVAQGASAIWKTVTGTLIHITDALASPVQELSVEIEPQQSGSGDPSPTNIRPIIGATGATIYRTGANICDLADAGIGTKSLYNLSSGTISIGGSGASISGTNPIEITNTTTWRGAVFFSKPMKSGQQCKIRYRITGTSVSNIKRTTYIVDKNNSIVSKVSYSASPDQNVDYVYTQNVTAISDGDKAVFIVESANKQTITIYDLSFNCPSTDTDYHAYSGTTYPISWQTEAGETVMGTLDVTNGILTKTWSKRTYTGASSEAWEAGSSQRFYIRISPNALYYRSSPYCIKSNMLPNIAAGSSGGNKNSCFVNAKNEIGISVYNVTTLADLRQFLSENNLQIIYYLATPAEYQLTPTEVSTLAGENNIWTDVNGEITLTYQAVPETAFSDNADTGMADYMTLTE